MNMVHRNSLYGLSAFASSRDSMDVFDFEFDKVDAAISEPLDFRASAIQWPAVIHASEMPISTLDRGTWFLSQLSLSNLTQPGAFVTPSIFVANDLWNKELRGTSARQVCMRAAFILSLAKTIKDLKINSKLKFGLKRQIAELWDQPLALSSAVAQIPPSPPLKTAHDRLPGPVRIRHSAASRLKSLVRNRRSLSPPPLAGDYLFQVGNESALHKYASAINSLVEAIGRASPAWIDFIVYELATCIGNDTLQLHHKYMNDTREVLKF